jgi:cytochrome c
LLREVHSHGWGINVLTFLPDREALLFGGLDGTLAVLDPQSGEVIRELESHARPVLALARSADGRFLASGGGDGVIQVFDAASLERVERYETAFGPVWALALSADGQVALHAGLDDFVKVWRVMPRLAFEPADGAFPRRFQASRDLDPGERQFARKCSVCHTLTPGDGNRAGPTLHGLFGRRAGSVPGYPYSESLRRAGIIWNEDTISELFDHGPDVVTPGSKMPIQRLKSAEDRGALIAFLKRATAPKGAATPKPEGSPTP